MNKEEYSRSVPMRNVPLHREDLNTKCVKPLAGQYHCSDSCCKSLATPIFMFVLVYVGTDILVSLAYHCTRKKMFESHKHNEIRTII